MVLKNLLTGTITFINILKNFLNLKKIKNINYSFIIHDWKFKLNLLYNLNKTFKLYNIKVQNK